MKPLITKRQFSVGNTGFMPNVPQNARVRRFYKTVDVVEHPLQADAIKLNNAEVSWNNLSMSDHYYAIKLDNRVIKTMYKDVLMIPSYALAVALAQEWDS